MLSEKSLPKVGILYESVSSASPLQIVNSSRNLAEPVFLYGYVNDYDERQLNVLKKRFTIWKVENRELDEIALICKNLNLCGLITFSDSQVENVSIICEKNKYTSLSEKAGKALQDKYIQRQTLEKIDNSVNYCIFEDWIKNSKLREKIGYPAIIKPCRGSGSKWTKLINSVEEAKAFKKKVPSNLCFLVEEYLEGSSYLSKEFEIGDYISVEGIHINGSYFPIGITGKLPISDNFSETGMFFPYILEKELEYEVLKQCREASEYLEIYSGITHIEIKLTDSGPRIIEVNGRMGGYVYDLVKKQTGIDLISIAFKIAINEKFDFINNQIQKSKVAFQKFVIPEISDTCKLKGIDFLFPNESYRLELIKQEGDILDPLLGSYNNIGIIHGEAKDIEDLIQINRSLENFIKIEVEEVHE